MTFTSAWPSFAVAALVLLALRLPAMRVLDPPHRGAVTTSTRGRLEQLDGLRGLCALTVFLHHAPIFHAFEMTGGWWLPPIRFYQTLGPLAVSLFFMITGALFFGKLLEEHGRPDWVGLTVGRLARIAPLYLAALALLLATVACSQRGLRVPLPTLARELGCWLLLGAGPQVDIDGYRDTWTLDAGVTWTLRYEWAFYAALLPLGLAVRALGRRAPLLAIALLVASLAASAPLPPAELPPRLPVLVAMFASGMAAATVARGEALPPVLDAAGSLLLLGCLALTFDHPGVYGFATTVLLGAAFALVARGVDLFGLLRSRPARRLGEISFGVYLLQAPALAATFAVAPVPLKRSPAGFWLCVAAAALLLLAIATLAHLAIERPGIAAGRRLARSLAGRGRGS